MKVRDTSPVFVVGLPRSGTTLMAVCLDRHPALDCGPETHLFAHLATVDQSALLDPGRWPDTATDFVCSLATDGVLVHDAAGIDRGRIHAALAARPPSVVAMLESLTVIQAGDAGKPRWIEKTPRHLAYLPLIRNLWPDAAIIHMVRDPRARAVSMTRMPFGADSQVSNLLDGMFRDRATRAAVDADPRLLRVRLEDLVADPARELGRVCDFLGEPWMPAMLEGSAATAAIGANEWWKAEATAPIRKPAPDAWRDEMSPDVLRFAALYCADQLDRNGYPGSRPARQRITVVPAGEAVIRGQEPMTLALAGADVMLADLPESDRNRLGDREAVVFWGLRGQLLPDVEGRPCGWSDLARMGMGLVQLRLRHRPVRWVVKRTSRPVSPRPQERLFARLLRVWARCISPEDLVSGATARSVTAERA